LQYIASRKDRINSRSSLTVKPGAVTTMHEKMTLIEKSMKSLYY